MSDLLKKATEYAESIKADDAYHISKEDFENYAKTDFQAGYVCCQKEYEERLRWVPVEESKPRTAELVIVDSGSDLHACVAVAFIENGIWKYANGQALWFTPRRWRRFL